MARERKLPAVGKVISGTHGYFWWNNSIYKGTWRCKRDTY